jgi:hypothetical protein
MPTISQLVRKGRTKVERENKYTGAGGFTSTPRCLRQGLYDDTQKAEFSFAESGQSSSHQRL